MFMVQATAFSRRAIAAIRHPSPHTGRACRSACCWGGFGSGTAAAQTGPFYGEIDDTLRAELVQWSTHYWHRVDTGDKIKPDTFAFSNAALNSPLFNPVRAARPSLEELGLIAADACDGMAELTPGFGDAAIAAAFRSAMLEWKFTTNSSSNPSGTAVHTGLISSAPPEANWWVDGPLLISTKLPWATVAGANPSATPAASISAQTQAAIDKLINVAPIIAAASAGVTEAQKLLTGELSHADRFQTGVVTLLADGGWEGDVWRVDAHFGVFGCLPLVGVNFDDAFVLLDSTNGSVAGPFESSSVLNADALLGQHPPAFQSGNSVVYVSWGGCPITVASSWHPGGPPAVVPAPALRPPGVMPPVGPPCPNPGSTPPATPGAACWPGVPCLNPPNPAGGWANCRCSSTCGTWQCVGVEQFIGGTPTRVYTTVTYYNCGAGPAAPAGCPPAGCTAVKTETWY